jgi:ectoine hydroxylase-related dioxygenase (phytanoyl-CoA dioxygenase family)
MKPQGLHIDWSGPATQPGEYYVCNSLWPFTDFTLENGATRVVPGSHRWSLNPQDAPIDPMEKHPDEIQLVAPLGTVVIFNSHLWHGACENRSNAMRGNVTSYWCRWTWPHAEAATNRLTREAANRLGQALYLFDPPA